MEVEPIRMDEDSTGRAKDGQNDDSSESVKGEDAPHPQGPVSGLPQDHVVGLREPSNGQHAGRGVPNPSACPAVPHPLVLTLSQVEQLRGLNVLGGSAKAVFRQEF